MQDAENYFSNDVRKILPCVACGRKKTVCDFEKYNFTYDLCSECGTLFQTPRPSIDSEYERNGTANIFMFFNPIEGKRRVDITDNLTAKDWAHQIKKLVDVDYPEAKKITLVMDNLNTHVGASLYKTFNPKEARRILDKLDFHYTPKHGSWLNMAEIEFSILGRECLDRRIPDKTALIN